MGKNSIFYHKMKRKAGDKTLLVKFPEGIQSHIQKES